jgi:hypothetical protein
VSAEGHFEGQIHSPGDFRLSGTPFWADGCLRDWLSPGNSGHLFLIKNQFFLAFTDGAAVEQPIESQNKIFRA